MKNKGFTIVELIVAVAILGVLTIIAIPSVKTIQDNNKDSKYIAYHKAIKTASKAYVDAYDEDLFGSINSGCAKVPYSKLKEKELIEAIQVKDVDCGIDADTYVYVFKQRNGNHAYYANIKCRSGTKVVYSKQELNRESCGIEDDQGPTVTIVNSVKISDPVDDPYNNGKVGIKKGAKYPKLTAIVEDKNKSNGAQAIGLRPGHQKLHYQWYRNGSALSGTGAKGDLNVIVRDYYYPDASVDIPIPKSDMDEVAADAFYTVKVTGKVEDMDGNTTPKTGEGTWQPEYPENDSGFEFERIKRGLLICALGFFYKMVIADIYKKRG